jgi:hypothetical protein
MYASSKSRFVIRSMAMKWRVLMTLVFASSAACFAAEQSELRGRVVCLAEEQNASLPAGHEHLYGFKTIEGKSYSLVRTRLSEALFVDKQLHQRDLLLKGKLSADAQSFDPTKILSVKNGVVHDLYYYCDICAIEAVTPEICVCCQEPVRLVEKPLTK